MRAALPLRIAWCIVAGLLACGVPLWTLAYRDLWPFEVAIAGGFGLASALAGVVMARLTRRGEKPST